MKVRCDHCNKKHLVVIECTCCKKLCLKCFAPMNHSCERNNVVKTKLLTEATGIFPKIQKI